MITALTLNNNFKLSINVKIQQVCLITKCKPKVKTKIYAKPGANVILITMNKITI